MTAQRVEVWLHRFAAQSRWCPEAHIGLLGREERERAQAFVRAADRSAYLRSRVFLRHILARHAAVEPAALVFTRHAGGKPALDGPMPARRLRFNLSHTRELMACAVTLYGQADLGIDVEALDTDPGPLLYSRRVLSPLERTRLRWSSDEQERRERFFALWTLKEACAKAVGQGLRMDLSRLGFTYGRHVVRFHGAAYAPGNWLFWRGRPTHEHQLALAIRTPCAHSMAVVTKWVEDTDLDHRAPRAQKENE